MKIINKKLNVIIVLISLVTISLTAKDSIGIGLQFGALGSEKTFSNSSTISSDSISMPYTKKTFNPNIQFLLSFPICDVDKNCFLGLDVGYDFSWDFSYRNLNSTQIESYTLSHRFSLIPEFTYNKSNFRAFAGTGFAFGIEPYKYKSVINKSYNSHEYTNYKLFWTFNTGVKYKLGSHLFAIADMTFFVNIFDTYNDDDYESKASGSSVMEILPKVGVMYHF